MKNKKKISSLKTLTQHASRFQLFIPLGVFLLIQLQYLNFVPIWDGGWYASALQEAMEKPFHLKNYNLLGHPSLFYAFLVGLTQMADFGHFFLFRLLQAGIGMIGIYSFYKILQIVFGDKYKTEIFLGTSLLAVHPSFLGNSLQFTLDFPATAFFLAAMASLLYRRYLLGVILTLATVFTRETGSSLMMSFLAGYGVIYFLQARKWSRKDIKKILKWITITAIIGLFFHWVITHNIGRWEMQRVPSLFLRYDFTNGFILTHLLQIFWVNFNWVFTGFILLYLGEKYVNKLLFSLFRVKFSPPHAPLRVQHKILGVLIFVFIVNSIPLVNLVTFTNIRYRLVLLPLFLLLGLYCLTVILQDKPILRRGMLAGLAGLFFIQSFFTIDPLSRQVFGTFDFGRHKMLCMTSISFEVLDCGRDQRTYNLQYANMIPLANLAIAKMDLNQEVHLISQVQTHFFYIRAIDKKTGRLSLQKAGSDVVIPTLYSFNLSRPHMPTAILKEVEDADLPKRFYYLSLPTWSREHVEINRLEQRGYHITEEYTLDHHGYTMGMKVLEKR